jgi:hypothetical protein
MEVGNDVSLFLGTETCRESVLEPTMSQSMIVSWRRSATNADAASDRGAAATGGVCCEVLLRFVK